MIDQLLEFYYKYDMFQEAYLPKERAREIYQLLLDRGRLHIYLDESGNLQGYGESFLINYETLGKIVCGWNVYDHLHDTDIEHGNIAILENVTVHPDYRTGKVLRYLRDDFFKKNRNADFFCGHALRKRHQPWKTFSKQEAYLKYVREEVI